MALEVESADVLKLVVQFLQENGLQVSADAVQKESGVGMNTVSDVDKLVGDVREGRWDAVLAVMASLSLPAPLMMNLFEHIVLELLELREVDTARALLDHAPPLLQLRDKQPARFLHLDQLAKKRVFEYADAYGQTAKERRREALAEKISATVIRAAPARLLSLISDALKWQRLQGLLPKGSKFDLFLGRAPTQFVEEEKHPLRNTRKLKFGKKSRAEALCFSPDGQSLVTGSSDGLVEVWDFDTGKLRRDLPYQAEDDLMAHADPVLAITFRLDSEILATGSSTGEIKIWRLLTGSCVKKFPRAHTGGVTSLQFMRDGSKLLSSSMDFSVRIHGLRSGRTLLHFRGHTSFVNGAVFNEDNSKIVSCSSDGQVKVWDCRSAECLLSFSPHGETAAPLSIHGVLWRPHSPQEFFVCSHAPVVHLVTVDGRTVRTFETQGKDIVTFCVTPKGRFLYAVGSDHVLYCFDVDTAQLQHAVKLHEAEVLGLQRHPHRNVFATHSADHTVKIWRA